jgi:hypothetical protein
MEALVTAGGLVALADGRVEAVERDELLNFIDRQQLVPSISHHDIAHAFDHRLRQLEDRDSVQVIVDALRPLAGLSLASVVIRAAERVAAADRKIHFDRLPERFRSTIRWLRQPSFFWIRIPAGVLLICGGVLFFLPVFALWMLPLGLMLLAEDVAPLRSARSWILDWIERRRPHWLARMPEEIR